MFDSISSLIDKVGFDDAFKIILLGVLIFVLKIMDKHAKSNHVLAESVNTNFHALGDTLHMMSEQNRKIHEDVKEKNVYLNTEQTIDMFRDKCRAHTEDKVEVLREILTNNNLLTRKEEIKENIHDTFRAITNKRVSELAKYKSVVGDLASIVEDNIDWNELFEDTYDIVFNNKSSNKQKIFDFRKRMDKYTNKIERKIRIYGECNG